MKKIVSFFAIALIAVSCCCKPGDTRLPKADNYRTNDSTVLQLLQSIRKYHSTDELNSVMVVKDGKKVLEYYDVCYGPDFLNICWSASKTFTATAVGFAVQEGLLTVDDKLVDFLKPEQLPEKISDTLAGLKVYDLLRMASGLKADPIGALGSRVDSVTIKSTLEKGFRFEPGTAYKYNSFNTYLLSVIVTNLTGEKVSDYLKPRLFEPLGIRNYHWDVSNEGYDLGGWGLYISTESLAKMGLFFLNKGEWDGKQLLNREWMEEATSPQIMQWAGKGYDDEKIASLANHEKYNGYCYQMWRGTHNSVRLDGAHGQWSIVLPDDNAVIAITGNSKDMMKELEAVWNTVYKLVKE